MGWASWVATGLGVGYSPFAPGAAGSLVGLFFFLCLQSLSPFYNSLFLGFLFGAGVYTAGRSESDFNRKDPSQIVIDEICGMFLVLLLLPSSLGWRAAGFLLFRFFDIAKPPPIRRFEEFPGGWGIMLDDLWAAGYTVWLLRLMKGLFAG